MVKRLEKPLVSVIVPVYNSEKYVDEALSSIMAQTYTNLQVICVDDGSTDESLDILKKWHEIDSRILIISQDNKGAGVARNIGMQNANGKYIVFLDSDDVFHKNMIKFLVSNAEKHSVDVTIFGYYKFDGICKEKMINSPKILHAPINKVISSLDICDDLFQVDHGMPWNKFYNRQFLENIGVHFQELRSTNDEYFSRLSVVEAKRMMITNKVFVGYRVNNSDSLQGKADSKSDDYKLALIAIHDELKRRDFYNLYQVTYQKLIYYMIIGKVQGVSDINSLKKWLSTYGSNLVERCEIDLGLICQIIK